MKTQRELSYHILGFIFGVLFVILLMIEPALLLVLFVVMWFAHLLGDL